MAKNRMLPFGYKVMNGAVALNDEEANAVRRAYREYAAGASYKAIAEAFTADGIPYTPAKPTWNKNMVARLLQNEDYLGTDRYPPIIDTHDFTAARAAQKQLNYTEPPALRRIGKLLVCGECSSPLARRIHANGKTRWYCRNDNTHIPSSVTDEYLLESISKMVTALKDNPSLIRADAMMRVSESALQIARLQNNINDLLDGEIIDEAAVKELILRLATSRYDACDDTSATATALQDKLMKLKQVPDSDTEALMAIADHIEVSAAVTVSLALKSGQIFTEGA